MSINAKEFCDFAKSALESRELSKFEFTKSLSDAIELIADAGKSLGFSRRNMSQLDVTSLFDYVKKDETEISRKWKEIIENRLKEKEMNDVLLTGGGIIPNKDMKKLQEMGVGKLFPPGTDTKDIVNYIRAWVK